jgi:hypothetical protein
MEFWIEASRRTLHFENAVLRHMDIITPPARPQDRLRQGSLIDAILDQGLVDVDRNDLAKNYPALNRVSVSVATLVKRHSRYLMLVKVANKDTLSGSRQATSGS